MSWLVSFNYKPQLMIKNQYTECENWFPPLTFRKYNNTSYIEIIYLKFDTNKALYLFFLETSTSNTRSTINFITDFLLKLIWYRHSISEIDTLLFYWFIVNTLFTYRVIVSTILLHPNYKKHNSTNRYVISFHRIGLPDRYIHFSSCVCHHLQRFIIVVCSFPLVHWI